MLLKVQSKLPKVQLHPVVVWCTVVDVMKSGGGRSARFKGLRRVSGTRKEGIGYDDFGVFGDGRATGSDVGGA